MITLNGKEIEVIHLPDGTSQVKFTQNCVHPIIDWEFEHELETLWIMQLCCRYREATLKCSWLPYARQDKHDFNASFPLKFVLSEYDTHIIADDVHNTNIWRNLTSRIQLPDVSTYDLVLFPDKGAQERYSNLFDNNTLCCEKNRDSSGKITLKVPYVAKYDKILVLDDICDGGGTFIELAKQSKHRKMDLFVTHGIFSKGLDVLRPLYNSIKCLNIVGNYLTDEQKREVLC